MADMNEREGKSKKPRILLFERESEVIKVIQSSLADPHLIIDAVPNAVNGLRLIKNTPPDVIIANYEFPSLSAPELLSRTRRLDCDAPVIFFGPKSDDGILAAFRMGAADYWVQPFLGREIKERLSILLVEIEREQDETVDVSTAGDSGELSAAMDSEPSSDFVMEAAPEPEPSASPTPDAERELELLRRTAEQERRELTGLLQISSSLNISGDTKVSLNNLTNLAADLMNCEAASIMLTNEMEQVLEFVVVTGEKKHRLETSKIPLGDGIAGWVAMNGSPQIVNDTHADPRFTGDVDRQSGFETRKILAVPMRLDQEIIGVLEMINPRDDHDFSPDDLRIMTEISTRVATVIAATRKIEDQQNFFVQTTNIMVQAIEKKDLYAEGHAWRVAEYSHKIASSMGLSDSEKDILHFGALLHDIGKLCLPSYVFNKRSLSERDRELIRQHPVHGAKLLEPITLWKWVVPCVLYHHEHWDGTGYPTGRQGDAIPLGARIINLAEAFSVMRAADSYKKQMTLKESILEIMRMSGKQFDPEVVKVFVGVLEKENWPR